LKKSGLLGEPISLSDLPLDSSFDFPVKIIQEGTTRLAVPDLDAYVNGKHGLAALNAPVFYNPVMTFNRDVSVLFTACERPKTVLDGLAGTGARGVRIANEVGASHVTINDASAVAYAAIR
jgi:tRNA (guanine26-N2/guanine27-N2)-dimethyltransferase